VGDDTGGHRGEHDDDHEDDDEDRAAASWRIGDSPSRG
jgi:hypothetical protein